MRRTWLAICLALVALTLGANYSWHFNSQDQEKQDDIIIRDLMRSKLMYSQNIVEGLSIGRFDLIEAAATEIERVAGAREWVTPDDPKLAQIREEMKSTAVRLRKTAQKKNLEGAAVRYFELTMKCIDCHQALRKTDF
jgi:hypothetical protein